MSGTTADLLRASEQRLRLATEVAELGIWRWHIAEDRVTWENDRLYQILGIDRNDGPVNAARFLAEFVHPDDAKAFRAAVQEVMGAGQRFFFQGRYIRKDGDIRWVEFAGHLVQAADGAPDWVLGTARDITATKRAEEALSASEARYRRLFDAIDEGFCVCQMLLDDAGAPHDYRFLEVNPAFEGLTGLHDVLGRTAREMVPALDQSWFDMYGKVAIGGEQLRFELPADAMGRWFNVFATPTGEPSEHKFIIVFTNITERKRSELALRAADKRKSEFLATLAHELRNPLAPLRTGLEMLEAGAANDVDLDRVRAMMKRQMEQMVRLVDDLMDVSRVSLGKIELRMGRVELGSIVQQAAEATRLAMAGTEKKLSMDVPVEPMYIHGDPARLAQVIGNVLNNAQKFTAATGLVQLTLARTGDQAMITVADNGIGMTPDEMDRVFELFVQADVSLQRSTSGLGIGLTLCRNLLELHGGSIRVESDGTGRGSTFTITLPLLTETAVASPAASTPTTDAKPLHKILIVDDNRDAADSLAMLLSMLGHTVRVAYEGLEAVVSAGVFKPDLMLLDIGMPNLNGYEVAQRIRSKAWGAHMYIIALTGWGQPEDRQRSQEAGFDQHWVKPVDIAMLRKFLTSSFTRLGN